MPEPFIDPYQDIINRCERHRNDPSVLITRNREDMEAIHSPNVAAVVWLRDVSEDMKREIDGLQNNPRIHDIANSYRWDDVPLENMPEVRGDMKMLARLRAELAGELLTKPMLVARKKELINETPERMSSQMVSDSDFHSDREDVGLRLHTTYSGETIQGLSILAQRRLEKENSSSYPFTKTESAELVDKLSDEDVVNDVPLFAVVAFKGLGYQGPVNDPNVPHIAWRHKGPDRDRTSGIAAIFGLPYSESRRFDATVAYPEAKI